MYPLAVNVWLMPRPSARSSTAKRNGEKAPHVQAARKKNKTHDQTSDSLNDLSPPELADTSLPTGLHPMLFDPPGNTCP